ncbi:MAG: signal peptidase I [Clostridia bacterium]|nr:signal peptidase I [Clostridia bacterium]
MRKTEDVSFQFDKEEKISENIIKSNNNAVHKDKELVFSKTEKIQTVKEKKSPWEIIYEWMDSFVFSIILILIVFVFGFRVVGVDGESMMPTLNNMDWLAVQAVNNTIERGDIVVITQPNITNKPLIKRVIAVGGDTLDINFTTGEVKVNGEVIDEPYIMEPTQRPGDFDKPIRIPEGYLFVMGDNRNESLDSRFDSIGIIDERYVLGVANTRLFPFGEWEIE